MGEILENIIKVEAERIQSANYINMIKVEKTEFDNLSAEEHDIWVKLKKSLSKEQFNLVARLEEVLANTGSVLEKHMFREGVKAGLSSPDAEV